MASCMKVTGFPLELIFSVKKMVPESLKRSVTNGPVMAMVPKVTLPPFPMSHTPVLLSPYTFTKVCPLLIMMGLYPAGAR